MQTKKHRIAWNKGKKGIYSKETLKKISDSTRKAMSKSKVREKLRLSHIGKKHSKETKNKMSKSHIGLNTWMTGRKLSEEIKKKIGDSNCGKIHGPCSDEHKRKLSESEKGKIISEKTKLRISYNHVGMIGKHHTDEARRKMRLSRIEKISRDKFNGHQVIPNWNTNACHEIDEYGKRYGYNFQHAMNGGEHFINELGYFVDGYDKDKNVVIEYYEFCHNQFKNTIHDKQRKQEIINHLGCEFIELKEWENIDAKIV